MSSFGYGHRFGWGRRRRRDVTPTDPTVLQTEADEDIQTETAEPILVQP